MQRGFRTGLLLHLFQQGILRVQRHNVSFIRRIDDLNRRACTAR